MFERTWTANCPANGGPVVIPVTPDGEPHLVLEAWSSALEGSNVFIFEDSVSLTDAQDRIAAAAVIDCLLAVPRGGAGCVRIPGDIQRRLSVFFDTAAVPAQAVTIRIYERGVSARASSY